MNNKKIMILIILALGASVFGSLYYGYYGDFFVNITSGDMWNRSNALVPCDMCWYIRVGHYAAFIVALLALRKRDYIHSSVYIAVLTLFGGVVAGYKYLLELGVIGLSDTGICNPSAAASCDSAIEIFGPYVTLATLGLLCSIVVIALCWRLRKSD